MKSGDGKKASFRPGLKQGAEPGAVIWSKQKPVISPENYIRQLWAETEQLRKLLEESEQKHRMAVKNFKLIAFLLVEKLGGQIQIPGGDIVSSDPSNELIEYRDQERDLYVMMTKRAKPRPEKPVPPCEHRKVYGERSLLASPADPRLWHCSICGMEGIDK